MIGRMEWLLGVLFVGLKLTGYIDWSWWWVTAPFWAPFGIVVAIFLVACAAIAVAAFVALMIGFAGGLYGGPAA